MPKKGKMRSVFFCMYSPDDLVALSGSGNIQDILKVLQARAEVRQNFVRIKINLPKMVNQHFIDLDR